MRSLIAILLLGSAMTCRDAPRQSSPSDPAVPLTSAEQPLRVSLIQLIATPERFDGEYVQVVGFYRSEFEGTGVYLHREDFEHGLSRNGVWVTRRDDTASDQHVIITGRFDAEGKGHMGLWSGSIREVTRLDPYPLKRAAAGPLKD